jgi:hypothetical protein
MTRARPNPVTDGVLRRAHGVSKSCDDREQMQAIVAMAEERFGIIVDDEVYGCGSYGCAFPTTRGDTLKITYDPDELYLPLHMAGSLSGLGYAHVLAGPFPSGIYHEGRGGSTHRPVPTQHEWLYYLREGVDPIGTLTDAELAAFDILREMGRAAVEREPEVYVRRLGDLGQLVQKRGEAPEMLGIYRLLRILAARPTGPVMLFDLKPANTGRRRGLPKPRIASERRHTYFAPDIVIFDSQVMNP